MNTRRLTLNMKMVKSNTDLVRDIVLEAPFDLDGNVTLGAGDVSAIMRLLAQTDTITLDCRDRLGKGQ